MFCLTMVIILLFFLHHFLIIYIVSYLNTIFPIIRTNIRLSPLLRRVWFGKNSVNFIFEYTVT